MKQQRRIEGYGILVLITLMGFTLLFTYLSLNLKTIDFGYEMQELLDREQQLKEEIDKLKSDKARLLNLERVERVVIRELGYRYPEPDQFIKVFEGEAEEKR
jgi:cell division protein FtsL